MRRKSRVWLSLCAAYLTVFAGATRAQDQSSVPSDPIETEYSSGLEFVGPDIYRSFSKLPTYRAFLPEFVDLSDLMPTPGDQGKLNACVGWAVGYAVRSYYSVAVEKKPRNDLLFIASPGYIFNETRKDKDCREGSQIPNALNFRLVKGSLSLADYPQTYRCTRPNDAEMHKATSFRIKKWGVVDLTKIDDVKGQLANQNPIIVGMQSPKGFQHLRGDQVLQSGGTILGPHALVLVGYDEKKQAFKVMNSWGQGWGNKGFGWVSYDAFRAYVREAYAMFVTPLPQTVAKSEVTAPESKAKQKIVVERVICLVLRQSQTSPLTGQFRLDHLS